MPIERKIFKNLCYQRGFTENKDYDRKVNTNHLCVLLWGGGGKGKETFKGKKKQIYNVEEVDQTSASPEDEHNLIINMYLAPDLFPTQRLQLKPRKNPKREKETFI